MRDRRLSVIVGCIFLVSAMTMLILWLDSRSDTALARWSSIAGVLSAVIATLTLVAAAVPLWRHDNDTGTGGTPSVPPAKTRVTWKIRGRNMNVAGRDQFIVNPHQRDDKR